MWKIYVFRGINENAGCAELIREANIPGFCEADDRNGRENERKYNQHEHR
jgi:hypothetical protein